MSTVLTRLRERRAQVWESAKELANRAADQNRSFSGEEQSQWDALNTELDTCDERIKTVLDQETRAKAADDAFDSLLGKPKTPGAGRSEADQQIDTQLRRMALDRDPRPVEIAPGPNRRVYHQPGIERRDLLTTSGTGLKVSVYDQLLMHLVELSAVLRAGASLIVTPTGESLKMPKSTAHSTAAIVAEGGTIGESDPTVGAATLSGFKYGFLVQCSYELLRDATFDVAGYLAQQAAAAINVAWGSHAINGTGSGQPRGVLLDGTVGVTGPTGTATSLGTHTTVGMGGDLLADLIASFAEPYVRSPGFAMLTRNASLNIIRKLRDGQSRYVFSLDAPVGSGASGSVFGVPIYVDPSVPAMAANAKSIIGADWSRVFVRQVGAVRFERSDDFAWNADLATYRCLTTLDSALVDSSGALKWFANSAT